MHFFFMAFVEPPSPVAGACQIRPLLLPFEKPVKPQSVERQGWNCQLWAGDDAASISRVTGKQSWEISPGWRGRPPAPEHVDGLGGEPLDEESGIGEQSHHLPGELLRADGLHCQSSRVNASILSTKYVWFARCPGSPD